MQGWVKIQRKIWEWEWYHDSNMVHLWLHLILKANHKPLRWRGKVIERGQVLTSYRKLSRETGISFQKIRTLIKRLKSTHEITQSSTQRNTIITITNYSKEQRIEKESTQESTQELTFNQHTINTASNKNDKKDNKKTVCPSKNNRSITEEEKLPDIPF